MQAFDKPQDPDNRSAGGSYRLLQAFMQEDTGVGTIGRKVFGVVVAFDAG
jgi:hypothetical protein